MKATYIKLIQRSALGVKFGYSIVAKYANKQDAEACTLPGKVYPAITAYSLLKKQNDKK